MFDSGRAHAILTASCTGNQVWTLAFTGDANTTLQRNAMKFMAEVLGKLGTTRFTYQGRGDVEASTIEAELQATCKLAFR